MKTYQDAISEAIHNFEQKHGFTPYKYGVEERNTKNGIEVKIIDRATGIALKSTSDGWK